MASLIEELISTLKAEKAVYEELVPVSEKKTKILVKNDLEELKEITAQEQLLIDRAGVIGHKREEVIKNIGVVLNKTPEQLDLTSLTRLMAKQPEEKKTLAALHDSLRTTMRRLVEVNERNKDLIENSLEMIEFNMNFIQSTRMSPGNNNYNRNATNSYTSDYGGHGFDAKQ
ncbi:MAG: flagellar protein FlgN [Clostridia bacterium]|nr:flagellar protein FlgN [Clostridia bacterium]MCI9078487.1 flagellar protein FlgN [Lachnospiraceae bacterium]